MPTGQKTTVDIGSKYNSLTVIKETKSHRKPNGQLVRKFLCQCECGNNKIISIYPLINGKTKTCGWLSLFACKNRFIKHGNTIANKPTPEYRTWVGIKNRCHNVNEPAYKNYGGRGIFVCNEWMYDFERFLKYMGKKPSPKHSIDRIDNSRGYSPDNCRWATAKEQNVNTRRNVFIEFNNEIKTMHEWASIINVPYKTLHYRIRKMNWTVHKAFTTPLMKNQFG